MTVLSPSKVGIGDWAANNYGRPERELYPAPPQAFLHTSTARRSFSEKVALNPART
jgi:hypothetical protein